MPRIVTATHVARFLSTRVSSRGGTKQLCLLLAWLTIFKSSLSLLVILPHYLSDQKAILQTDDKYFKLVETFLIVVVSQNVFNAEIDNPFFYKVFQLAPGGGGFARKFCPGGWWNSP